MSEVGCGVFVHGGPGLRLQEANGAVELSGTAPDESEAEELEVLPPRSGPCVDGAGTRHHLRPHNVPGHGVEHDDPRVGVAYRFAIHEAADLGIPGIGHAQDEIGAGG